MNWYTVKIKTYCKMHVAVKAKSSRDALLRVLNKLSDDYVVKRVSVKREDLTK